MESVTISTHKVGRYAIWNYFSCRKQRWSVVQGFEI